MAAWRNGIASDYESGDCRFDPCGGHLIFFCSLGRSGSSTEEPVSPAHQTSLTMSLMHASGELLLLSNLYILR